MGKWSSQYTDDVLGCKMRELITASIERVKHDNGHSISYESFVQELSQGDMFCSKMMDLLVMELADRRLRVQQSDKRSISDKTLAGLHSLSAGSGYNKDLPSTSRAWSSFGTGESGRVLSDDEDGTDPLLEIVDGARLGTELYESYASNLSFPYSMHQSAISQYSRGGSSPPPLDEDRVERAASPVMIGRNSLMADGHQYASTYGQSFAGTANHSRTRLSAGPSDLVRRSSVRRREFGDWATRRRSVARSSAWNADYNSTSTTRNDSRFEFDRHERLGLNPPMPDLLSRRSRREINESLSADGRGERTRTNSLDDRALPSSMRRLRRGGLQPPEMYTFPAEARSGPLSILDEPIPGLDDLSPPLRSGVLWDIPASESLDLTPPRSVPPPPPQQA